MPDCTVVGGTNENEKHIDKVYAKDEQVWRMAKTEEICVHYAV